MELMTSSLLLWLLFRALKATWYVAWLGALNHGSRNVGRYLSMSSGNALHVPLT